MKFLFVLFALLSLALASPQLTIHSINVIPEDEVTIDDGNIDVIEDGDIETVGRAPKETAVFAVEKVEVGYAKTTRVGLTVQKGTSGVIHFKIRLHAVTVERLNSLTKEFQKTLTKTQKKSLKKEKKKCSKHFFCVAWLKSLGIDLDKGVEKVELEKVAEKQTDYIRRSVVAKKMLKDVVKQHIEVSGTLRATGVSFIPTTVFSFIRLARVYFEDGSKLLVLSQHPGGLAAADEHGNTVPTSDETINIVDV